MARVVVTGAGIGGLTTAMLLACDGHEVTLVERDAEEPPASVDQAWAGWERRGVNQFRLLHFFLARFRILLEAELPEAAGALDAAGALRFNPVSLMPDSMSGGMRPGDEDFEMLTGRRPVVEAVLAQAAGATPGLSVRRGTAVAGLLTERSTATDVPHVVGVSLEGGEELRAELVVDATGRRSPLPRWLAEIGARPPIEEMEDSGFLYYGRYFRSDDGSIPAMLGGGLQHYDTLSVLILPADNGTWGVGLITSGGDAPLRSLRQPERWMATVRSYPLVAHFTEGEPLADGVDVMAKIEDRCRRFCVDGTPVATGVVAVADSWACTNPSVGRGASIGFLHAVGLRDLVRSHPIEDHVGFALAWDALTEERVAPWYRETLWSDRHRLAQIEAGIEGRPYEPEDPKWDLVQSVGVAAGQDPDVLRGFLRNISLLETLDDVFADPELTQKALSLGSGWREAPSLGPNRQELLAVAAG